MQCMLTGPYWHTISRIAAVVSDIWIFMGRPVDSIKLATSTVSLSDGKISPMTAMGNTHVGKIPEDTVVGDLGADDAPDDAPAVHSHSQLESGARLVLNNAFVRGATKGLSAEKLGNLYQPG